MEGLALCASAEESSCFGNTARWHRKDCERKADQQRGQRVEAGHDGSIKGSKLNRRFVSFEASKADRYNCNKGNPAHNVDICNCDYLQVPDWETADDGEQKGKQWVAMVNLYVEDRKDCAKHETMFPCPQSFETRFTTASNIVSRVFAVVSWTFSLCCYIAGCNVARFRQ